MLIKCVKLVLSFCYQFSDEPHLDGQDQDAAGEKVRTLVTPPVICLLFQICVKQSDLFWGITRPLAGALWRRPVLSSLSWHSAVCVRPSIWPVSINTQCWRTVLHAEVYIYITKDRVVVLCAVKERVCSVPFKNNPYTPTQAGHLIDEWDSG